MSPALTQPYRPIQSGPCGWRRRVVMRWGGCHWAGIWGAVWVSMFHCSAGSEGWVHILLLRSENCWSCCPGLLTSPDPTDSSSGTFPTPPPHLHPRLRRLWWAGCCNWEGSGCSCYRAPVVYVNPTPLGWWHCRSGTSAARRTVPWGRERVGEGGGDGLTVRQVVNMWLDKGKYDSSITIDHLSISSNLY